MRKSYIENTPSLEVLEQALAIRREIATMEGRLVALLNGYHEDENVTVRRSPRAYKLKSNQPSRRRR